MRKEYCTANKTESRKTDDEVKDEEYKEYPKAENKKQPKTDILKE